MAHETVQRPRERRREATLARILDAAMEAVTTDGLGALSMNKLAAAVDFTPGALYRYFDSKDALLSALVNRVLDELNARLARSVTAGDPYVRVLELAHAYRSFAAEEPHKFGLIAMSMAEPKVLLGTPASTEPVVRSIVSALTPLADAIAAAELSRGDSFERTLVMFSAIQGALLLRKQARMAPQLIDVDRLITEAVRTLLCGWGADPSAVEKARRKVLAREKRAGGSS